MLDTLREVTDEQYRDALEREAARSAAELDAVPEESARNVVIVVNPKDSDEDDDFISEESHVKESRCIHPLESLPLGKMRSSANPINILPESFKFLKQKNPGLPPRNLLPFDSNVDASSVKESIVDPNGNLPTFLSEKYKIPLKSILGHNDRFRFGKPDLKLGKFNEKESDDGFKLSLVPKLKSHTNIGDDIVRSASSNVQHESELVTDESSQLFQNNKLPLSLRNLLKLKDVELIPKSIRNKSWAKPKLDVSKFAIPSLFKSDQSKNLALSSANKDLKQRETDEVNDNIFDSDALQNNRVNSMHGLSGLFDDLKADSMLNKNLSDDNENHTKEGIQINLDALPSPSQIKSSIIRADQEKGSEAIVLPQSISDCDFLDSKELALNTPLKEVLDDSHDFESDSSTFKSTNVATENMSNLNDDTEASNFMQDQDSETDSSNILLSTLVPLESQEKTVNEPTENQKAIESDSEFIEGDSQTIPEMFAKTLEDEKVPHVKETLSLGETLSNLRESVVKQLGNLKNPSIKSELFRTLDGNDNLNLNEEEKTIRGDINQITTNLDPANTAEREAIENVTGISMNDLQNMSDQLLDSNINSQNNNHFLDSTANNTPYKMDFKSSDISDTELSETKLNPIVIESEINVDENACPTNLDSKNANMSEDDTTKSATPDTKQKEMDTGASDTVINTLPGILDSLNPNLKLRSPLLSDIALQPSSNPLNLLGKPLGDVLSLNPNLPTLDDLRDRLTNIFSTDDGSIENDSSSLETDFTNNFPVETMATEASTRNSQKELPLLKQLEEFNNDIVQKRPKIPNPFDALTKSRVLDLNSYRAHLPSPNSLDLKPLKLEPRVQSRAGKNKPLINFGSDKTVPRKSKPSSTLANPLDSFPTLEVLRNTLRSNSKNLLNSPLHSDLLSENLRLHDIEDVAENIRLNTEKTFKGIQRKMKSSLRKPNLHNPLRESLAKPQELLDDVNDKLKGIHYDLNDRLSSLRETILDSSRINAFTDQPRKASNRNVMTNPRNFKTKSSSPRVQTAASTTTNHEIDPNQLGSKSRNYVHPNWNMLRKTQTAAESASAPARVEMPKSVSPPWSHLQRISPPFRQNPIVTESLKERTPIPPLNTDETHSKDIKSPFFRTALSPFNRQRQQNKITITFGTTTARPILPPRPLTRVPNMSTRQFEDFNPSSTSDTFDAFNTDNTAAMSAVSTGKFKPSLTSAPIPSPADEDFEDTLNNFAFEELPSTGSKLKSSVLREMSMRNPPKLHINSNRPKSANIFDNEMESHASKSVFKTSHWPKLTENTFMSKVRDAAKNLDVPKPVKDVRSEQLDMLRSPTDNTDIVIDEPLKENVSYRCRMVCTKEIK